RPVRPVVSKPVANVHALLEMTPQWKREEGPARGDELHAGAEAPLHEGEVAARKMLEQLVHVGPHLEAVDAGEGIDGYPRPGHEDHAQLRRRSLHDGERPGDGLQQMPAHAGTA